METFAVRMARHGILVSSIRMKYDARYALERLSQAHTFADTGLREFAVELFRHFERRQSALACYGN
jgi:hypothetical protein